MSSFCPQCKAVYHSAETCQDRYTLCQFKEIELPAYYIVHHLSVPCYMLQHNIYSLHGWIETRKLLTKFIHDNWTPAVARRENRMITDNGNRTWSYTKGAKLSGVESIVWGFTIADVRLDTAETYCADVRRWAENILSDSEKLFQQKKNLI